MNNSSIATRGSTLMKGGSRGGVVLLAAFALSGCDGILDARLPGRVTVDTLNDPTMASTLVLGAIGDFECAFNEYVHASSIFTNELITSTIWNVYNRMSARNLTIDEFGAAGCVTTSTLATFGMYRPIQTARYQAEDVYSRISDFSGVANKDNLLGQVAAYAGYSYVLLGEGYCNNAVAIDGGARVGKQALFTSAETWFSRAIDHAQTAGNAPIRQMATLGRARARLNLGNKSGALADAQAIPSGFVFNVSRGTSTAFRENRIFQAVNNNRYASVGPAYRNLTVGGVADNRVPVVNTGGPGNDGQTPQWHQTKYPSLSAPLPLASWKEAQLIIAEIQGGQEAVAAINRLRQRAGLPLFSSTDEAEIRRQIIEERSRELWLEGHLINDRQRFDLAWEQGLTHKGDTYSDLRCFPVMQAEQNNNPNF